MIIVTGAAGQLGTDVVKELERRGTEHTGIDIAQLDITDSKAVDSYFRALAGKNVCLINCAAYTAVDKAEDEPELCFRINEEGTANLAKACSMIDAEMIHISTDYVFGGEGDMLLETDAAKNPVSVYGKSKLAGEQAVLRHLRKYYIVRISWAFGQGGPNFVKTMLRLAGERDAINVVCDQTGSPSYTPDLAVLLCDMALSGKYGTYHATNEGFCTWAEFAGEIMRLRQTGDCRPEMQGKCVKIIPVTTAQYPAKAARPKNSRLSKKSLDDAGFKRLPAWQDALKRFMQELSLQEVPAGEIPPGETPAGNPRSGGA